MWSGVLVAGLLMIVLIIGLQLPAEYRFIREVVIPLTPDRSWRWFVRPDHWSKRFSMIHISDKVPSTKDSVGTHRRIVFDIPGGGEIVSEIEVTEWVEGKLYADRHLKDTLNGKTLPIDNAGSRFEFRPEGEKKTRLIFNGFCEVHGFLNKWFAYLVLKPTADQVIPGSLPILFRSIERDEKNPSNEKAPNGDN
jgi:hypothetical protein